MTTDGGLILPSELASWSELAEKATPGPWHYVHCDDDHYMNALYVSTNSEEPDGPPSENVICGTLVQVPATIGHESGKWHEDAEFIAISRTALPRLIAAYSQSLAEVERLKAEVAHYCAEAQIQKEQAKETKAFYEGAIRKHRASTPRTLNANPNERDQALWSTIEGAKNV